MHLRGRQFLKGQLMKLDNYILDAYKTNCDTLLFCHFISFTCENTGQLLKEIPNIIRKTLFFFLLMATGLKYPSSNE